MADNPYAEFQDSIEQVEKPAVKKPASPTGDNPYAEFQQDTTPAEQPKAEEEKPGVASKAWEAVNKPTYTPSEEEQGAYMKAKNYSTSAPTQEESKSPIWTGVKKGLSGAYADTADTLRGLTSPLGMATLAAGPAAEGAGAVGKTAGALGKIAGVGFGAQGAKEAYEGGKDIAENGVTPESAQKTLQGAGQALMGGTAAMHGVTSEGMKETATAPLRAGARVINAAKNNPEVTGAIAGGAAGLTHGPIGAGIGAIEGGRGGGMVNRFLKRVPDLNERVGMRPTEEQRNLVGNEYVPPAKAPVPPAHTGALPRIEYAEPTPHTPADLVGNEFTPETGKPVPEAAPTPKGALGRIEYGEPTPTKAEGLVGNEYTEGEKPKMKAKDKNPVSGIEYAEPTEHTKDITAEDVKSTPGTSMSPEGKAKAAGDQVHVDKAKEALGENAPTNKVLEHAKELKDKAAEDHETNRKATEENEKAATDAQMEAHEANGGSTFTPDGKDAMGQDKYSVGQYPDRTKSYGADFTDQDLSEFKKDNADLLKQPGHAVGTWKDPDTGKHVLDVVKLFGDRDEAIAEGKAANQKGIFGLKNAEYIDTGGTGEGTVDEAKAQAESEVPKDNEGTTEKDNKGEESKVSPEDVTTVNNVVKDLAEQDIIKAGKRYDVDHEKFDFKKRDEHRHRTERDQYAKDVTANIPDEMKQKLAKAAQEFDDKDSNVFDQPSRNSMSRAARARAIWDKAHEEGFGKIKEMSEGDIADFEHEINSSIPMGPTPLKELRDFVSQHSDKPLKFLSAGGEVSVYDLGNGKIMKVGKGEVPKVPDIPEVVQPLEQRAIPASTGEFHASIYPKLDTENIPYEEVKKMNARMDAKGYDWDYDPKNLGRTPDGEYKIIDAGAIKKKSPA